MRTSRFPLALSAVLAAGALLLTGCTATPGSAPAPTSTADEQPDPVAETPEDGAWAAWLNTGGMIAIVTMGSSSCVPAVQDATAAGQTVDVTLVDLPGRACTEDLRPRGSVAQLPDGVDAMKDVTLKVSYGEIEETVTLPALTGTPGTPVDYAPGAGWFSDTGIALLTWGSSSCVPQVEDVTMITAGADVAFATQDGVCTMDMAPRVSAFLLPEAPASREGFTLSLTGDNLDGDLAVLG